MVTARANGKYIRTSAQKAGLVCDLIRGKDVNRALSVLQFAKKTVARDLAKVLRSAVANARQREGFGGDVERLFVDACYADQGPSQKRIRPAPMGRAFRVVKRTAHLTVRVSERPNKISAPAPESGGASATGNATAAPKRARGAKPKAKSSGGAKKKTAPRKKTVSA